MRAASWRCRTARAGSGSCATGWHPRATAIEGLQVLESRNPLFRIPTTGVVAGSDFVYLANPNLEALDDDGHLKKDAHLEDVVVLRTAAPNSPVARSARSKLRNGSTSCGPPDPKQRSRPRSA